MAGLLDDIGQFLNSQMGQGLLSSAFAGMAGAGRGDPLNNLGRAGLAGIMGYQNAPTAQLRQMLAEETRRKLDDMDASRKALTEYYSNRGMPQSPAQAALSAGESAGDIGPTVTNAARIPTMQGAGVTPKADVWQQYNDIGNMMAAKGLPEQAQQYYGLAEKFRPKYGNTPFIGANGQSYLVGDDGNLKPTGIMGKTDVKEGYLVPDGNGGWSIDPTLYKAAIGKASAGAAKQTTLVNSYMPASEAAQKDFMDKIAKRHDALQSAPVFLQNIEEAKTLIPGASKFMGPGGAPLMEGAKFLNNRLGLNVDVNNIKDAEALRTRLFVQVMENLKKMDAQPSQYQQQVMQEAFGTLGTDPKALPAILDTFGDIVKGKVSVHNQEVQSALDRGVKFPYDPLIGMQTNRDGNNSASPGGGSAPIDMAAAARAELARRGKK